MKNYMNFIGLALVAASIAMLAQVNRYEYSLGLYPAAILTDKTFPVMRRIDHLTGEMCVAYVDEYLIGHIPTKDLNQIGELGEGWSCNLLKGKVYPWEEFGVAD